MVSPHVNKAMSRLDAPQQPGKMDMQYAIYSAAAEWQHRFTEHSIVPVSTIETISSTLAVGLPAIQEVDEVQSPQVKEEVDANALMTSCMQFMDSF